MISLSFITGQYGGTGTVSSSSTFYRQADKSFHLVPGFAGRARTHVAATPLNATHVLALGGRGGGGEMDLIDEVLIMETAPLPSGKTTRKHTNRLF